MDQIPIKLYSFKDNSNFDELLLFRFYRFDENISKVLIEESKDFFQIIIRYYLSSDIHEKEFLILDSKEYKDKFK